MSNLKMFDDEEHESKFGRVFAVSGPGKKNKKLLNIILSDEVVTTCLYY